MYPFVFSVIGDWHLAHITAACVSNLGHRTLLVNPDNKIKWNSYPELLIPEPDLKDMVHHSIGLGLLEFRNGFSHDSKAEFPWVALDTPVDHCDNVDLAPIESIFRRLKNSGHTGPVIISSQIPVGFCHHLIQEFGFEIIYIPENLRLGKGIETFLNADRIVVGADKNALYERIHFLLNAIKTEFIFCNLTTAEMIKHATNAFLATSISFANEMAKLGEVAKADNETVAKALKLDKRIGKGAYILPGLGFGGGTLPRDLRILKNFAKQHELTTPLVDAVLSINEMTLDFILQSVKRELGSLRHKNILIMGYTYKAETTTLRRSLSMTLAENLSENGANIYGFDPAINSAELASLHGSIQHITDCKDLKILPDAILVMTALLEFSHFNWQAFAKKKGPVIVFDTRRFLSENKILEAGLSYKALFQPIVHAPQ